MQPEPIPTTTPQSRNSCHGSVIHIVPKAPRAMATSAHIVTRRRPKRACSAAANGPTSPNSSTLMLTAVPTVARSQPNSSRSGSTRMPGAERKPAAPSSVTNEAPKTTQA